MGTATRGRGNADRKKSLINIRAIPLLHDFWGKNFKRYLNSEGLKRTLKMALSHPQSELITSLSELRGGPFPPEGLHQVNVSLFQEGDFQYVFKVTVRTCDGAETLLAMIVAKDTGHLSQLARSEHGNLKYLYQRRPEYLVRPLSGGELPVSPQQGGLTRPVYYYFTCWLSRFHELGVNRQMNFYINEIPYHHFDRQTSDFIKVQILKILFSCYDPVSQRAIEPAKIGAGDFVITRPEAGKPIRLRLIACRRISAKVTLEKCLSLYLGYHGDWGDKIFTYIPSNPMLLTQAINDGLIVPHHLPLEDVIKALTRYRDKLTREREWSDAWSPLPVIRQLLKPNAFPARMKKAQHQGFGEKAEDLEG
ncbi:MAG: hypothetical protein HQK60_01170 [Deltaproteobacteria bacterium]|nr:hypothetical protein [Deltaproteobacteria bacterium]